MLYRCHPKKCAPEYDAHALLSNELPDPVCDLQYCRSEVCFNQGRTERKSHH